MGTIKSLLCHCSLICFCCQSFLSLLKLMFPPLQDSSSSMKDLSETSILLNMELDIVPWQFPITHFTSSFTPPPQRFHSCLGIGGPDSMMRWVSEATRFVRTLRSHSAKMEILSWPMLMAALPGKLTLPAKV